MTVMASAVGNDQPCRLLTIGTPTFESKYGLVLALFLLDALEESGNKLGFLATDLFLRILSSQDVNVRLVALLPTLNRAALACKNLLYTIC